MPISRRAGWLLVLAAGLALASPPRAAAQRSLHIERFDAEIEVNPSGAIDVTERIRVRFQGAWNGVFRVIPDRYLTPRGLTYRIHLEVIAITDGSGRSLEYEPSRDDRSRTLKIWVPEAVDAVRTVAIRYRVQRALRHFAEHDELYWNVTGDEWQAPIDVATARVSLPDGATGLRAVAFTGVYGARDADATVGLGTRDVRVETTSPLGFRQGLTVVVGWDPGVVDRPSALDRALDVIVANVVLVAPLALLPPTWLIWRRWGRDPRRRPVTVRYSPPEDLRPAEIGTLADHTPHMRDITATIVDLAVRGLLVIEEIEGHGWFGARDVDDYRLRLVVPRSEWQNLRPFEHRLLVGLFDHPDAMPPEGSDPTVDSVTVSSLEHAFYEKLPAIKTALYDELMSRRHYLLRPDRMRRAFLTAALVVGGGTIAVGSVLTDWLGGGELAPVVAGILCGAILAGFGWLMPARTVSGTRTLEHVLGFEEFLRRVEDDRFDRSMRTPQLFERFLPYAMALGIERTWARAFDDVATRPPTWYRGGSTDGFRANRLGSSLSRMASTTGGALSSTPRGSGGSGFSGGSSGGGFGGGGGGGF